MSPDMRIGTGGRAPGRGASIAAGAALLAALLAGAGIAGEKPALDNANDRINYSVGYQVGGDFGRHGVALNPDAFLRGIRDAMAGIEPQLPRQEMWSTLAEFKKKVDFSARKQKTAQFAADMAAGTAFLAENAKKDGVVTRESGLQYKVLADGTGKSPSPTDAVTVRYRATFLDGTEFDSSERKGKPVTFRIQDAIAGWQEALPLMKEGAKWMVYLPSRLAYDGRGALEGRTVVFELELVSVGLQK